MTKISKKNIARRGNVKIEQSSRVTLCCVRPSRQVNVYIPLALNFCFLFQKDEINTVAPPLDYHHVAGIFWITFAGVTAACFWVFIELGIHIIKKGVKDKRSFLEEYKEEVKYNFSFKHSVKPMKDGKIAAVFTRNQNKLGGSSTENLNN